MKMRVVAYTGGLNIRSEPVVAAGNIIGQAFFLQIIDVEGAADNGFMRCAVDLPSGRVHGFVSAKFLRKMLSPHREVLITQAYIEHQRFKRGLGKEHIRPFSDYVGEMWRSIGLKLDGTDRDQPWSAAAISFMVRNAGRVYEGFRFAAAHSKFTHASIRARHSNDTTAPFWGYDLFERQPQPGDIVVRDNPDHAPAIDFELASRSESYRSHSDIIVHVDSAKQKVIAMGGNVDNSLGIAMYDLAPGDYLATTRRTFALLANRADEIDA